MVAYVAWQAQIGVKSLKVEPGGNYPDRSMLQKGNVLLERFRTIHDVVIRDVQLPLYRLSAHVLSFL